MKLNRKWILLVALVLSVAMATTGTLAYLTDEDKDVNTMTLGKVEIVQNEQERREDGTLDEFTQNKPAYPAVGEIDWAETGVTLDGVEYKVFDDGLKNVIDKFVTVTNTGKSDAYVRTIVAIEAPDYDINDLIHINVNVDGLTRTSWAPVDIDGVQYIYSVFTYEEALAPGKTSAPSLMQLFLDKKTTNEDVAKFGEEWDVLVLSQAVQVMGFEEMGAAAALDEAFEPVTAENLVKWLGETEVGSPGDKWGDNNPPIIPDDAIVVDNVEDLLAALKIKDAKVYVEGGTYEIGGSFGIAEGVTVVGMTDDVNLKGTLSGTVKNITLKNINIEGSNAQRWAYASGNNQFVNCTFEGTGVYALHFDDMSGNLTYRNCDIIGWAAMGGSPESILFENCTISGNGTYGVIRVYSDATMKNCTFDVDNVNTEDQFQDGVHAVDCTVTMINCKNVNGSVEDLANVSGTGVVDIQ